MKFVYIYLHITKIVDFSLLIEKKSEKLPFAIGETERGCDIFNGRWVWDKESRPLYEEDECPYIQPQLTCQEHGRPDKDYQHWRWQPNGCSLPRFFNSFILAFLLILQCGRIRLTLNVQENNYKRPSHS